MQQELSEQHPIFPNLNGLRLVSAVAIILYHCYTLNREIWGDFYLNTWFQKSWIVISKGHMGVDLFFVLSGFLITYLLLHENARKGKINLTHFLFRRFLRIWPLYFAIVLFGFFIFPELPYGIETVHSFWRFALFLSNIDEILVGMNDSINFLTATWTVSVEEQFYLVWGAFMGLIAFRKRMIYGWFLFSLIVLTFLFRFYHLDNHRVLYYHTFSVMSDFAVGGLIGLWAFTGGAKQVFENLPRYILISIYITGFTIILLEDQLFQGPLFIVERFVPTVFFAFVVLEQIYANNSFYKIDKIPRFFQAGKLTYGLYMYHCIYIYYWGIFFDNHGLTEKSYHFIAFVVVILASTYLTAWLSFRYFEKPLLELKRYFR